MMFWQLVSVFRNAPSVLEQVLEEPEWADYLEWYKGFNGHVNSQNRTILDAILPEQLIVRALGRCDLRFQIQDGVLRQCHVQSEASISAVDVCHRYGGEAIEEVLEKGSFQVPSRSY